MPMIGCKFTFATVVGVKKFTWTEKHYALGISNPEGAREIAGILADRRSLLLGWGIVMGKITVSDDDVLRDSLQVNPPGNFLANGVPFYNQSFRPALTDTVGDFAFADVMVRKESGTLKHTQMYLGGAPDLVQASNLSIPIDPIWVNAFNAYRNYLVQNFGMKTLVQGVAAPRRTIVQASVVGGGALFVTSEPHLFSSGNNVLISGGRVAVENRGTQRMSTVLPTGYQLVQVVDATSFRIPGWPTPYTPFAYLGGAIARKNGYEVSAYTNIQLAGFTKRDRGGSLFLPHGRRKTKALQRY